MRWQQPLQPGAVLGGDAHRGVEGEAAVVPREHVAGGVGVEQPAAGEPTQHPPAHLLGNGGNLLRCQCLGGMESHLPVVEALEYPVEDAAVEVDVAIERGPDKFAGSEFGRA